MANSERRPRYYLQAWPRSDVEVEGILATGQNALREILSRPREVRPGGFGLRTGLLPSNIPGGGLRYVTDRLSLSLERNGPPGAELGGPVVLAKH